MKIQQLLSPDEHTVVLSPYDSFTSLRRKEDLLAEGVAAIFAVDHGEAKLLALGFQTAKFFPVEVKAWLRENRLNPDLFDTEAGRMDMPDPTSPPQFGPNIRP